MKKLLPVLTAIFLVFTCGCKKDNPPTEDIEQDIRDLYALQLSIAAQFEASLANYDMSDFDDGPHSEALLEWILQQPNVETATMQVPGLFIVQHVNGLIGHIVFSQAQTEAGLITRGGAGASGPMKEFRLSSEDKLITNKKALYIMAHASDFYAPYCTLTGAKHIQDVIDRMEGGDVELDVTLRVNEGFDAYRDLSDYSFIIVSTHGSANGSFSAGEPVFEGNLIASNDLAFNEIIKTISEDVRSNNIVTTTYFDYSSNKEVEIRYHSYTITQEYVTAQNWQFDKGVFVANYCYSGYGFGAMGDVLANKGIISFYGYGWPNGMSRKVTNQMAWRCEDTIIQSLIYDIDTTGIAHLANGTTEMTDTVNWQINMSPRSRSYMATKHFIFTAQPMAHWLDPEYKYENCVTEFTDQRDGTTYAATCIGDQVWMAENLNYALTGMCYDNNPNSCETFGRLYTWSELTGGISSDADPSGVQGICPQGWHVPSMAEWEELIAFAGGNSVAGRKLKANSSLWVDSDPNTDDYGFAALPAGRCDGSDCYNEDDEANFWTSSTYGPSSPRHILIQGIDYLGTNVAQSDTRFSCRCVKDE